VSVESQVGAGSTFTIWLPLAQTAGFDSLNR
jgi:signal transduction histidine kinase